MEDPFGIRDPEDGDPYHPVPWWVQAIMAVAIFASTVGLFAGLLWLLVL